MNVRQLQLARKDQVGGMRKLRRNKTIVKGLSPAEFFQILFPRLGSGEQVELRCRNCKTNNFHSEFFHSTSALLARAEELKNTHDVYFGPATRHGDRGDKQHCYRSRVLWADIDGGQAPDVSPHPTIVV